MLMLPGGSTIKWGSDQVGINLLEVHPALHLDISHQVGRQDHPIDPTKLGGKIIHTGIYSTKLGGKIIPKLCARSESAPAN